MKQKMVRKDIKRRSNWIRYIHYKTGFDDTCFLSQSMKKSNDTLVNVI